MVAKCKRIVILALRPVGHHVGPKPDGQFSTTETIELQTLDACVTPLPPGRVSLWRMQSKAAACTSRCFSDKLRPCVATPLVRSKRSVSHRRKVTQ